MKKSVVIRLVLALIVLFLSLGLIFYSYTPLPRVKETVVLPGVEKLLKAPEQVPTTKAKKRTPTPTSWLAPSEFEKFGMGLRLFQEGGTDAAF
jgi:hypothetical protein